MAVATGGLVTTLALVATGGVVGREEAEEERAENATAGWATGCEMQAGAR